MKCPHCDCEMLANYCVSMRCPGRKSMSPHLTITGGHRNRSFNSARTPNRPNPTAPIPPHVNSREFSPTLAKESLLFYFGYRRNKDSCAQFRHDVLDIIINAGPLVPSRGNEDYIRSFGPSASKERIRALVNTLQKQIQGQWYVLNDPVKHSKKLPAIEKAQEDIEWLNSKLS